MTHSLPITHTYIMYTLFKEAGDEVQTENYGPTSLFGRDL